MSEVVIGVKRRLFFVFFLFMGLLIFLMGRVGYIKIVKGEEYEKRAILQQVKQTDRMIAPSRGAILDRNKNDLAISITVYKVILDPRVLIQHKEDEQQKTMEALQEVLDISPATVAEYLKKNEEGKLIRDTSYVILMRDVPKQTADRLREQKLKGIWLEEDSLRSYLYNSFASHVIGFVGGGTGRWGLEKQYNEWLGGIPGRVFVTSEQGNNIVSQQIPPQNGYSLISTLDQTIQQYAEQALRNAVELHNPLNASIIVMDPNTGEILGMTAYPSFNPNEPAVIQDTKLLLQWDSLSQEERTAALNTLWKNYNISYTYEPGSTFKPMVAAAALEENIIAANETFYCSGVKVVAGVPIRCWKRSGHGEQTLEEALANSCNIAVMDMAEEMGRDTFYRYHKAFGFGELTRIDLPGEESARSLLYTPDKLGPVELATSSFGQSFNVTPLQLLNGFSALINGGNLMKPYVVSQIIDENGAVVKENLPTVMGKVISEETSNLLRHYLQTVVDTGTGKLARIAGYEIGGKTGTAQKGNRDDENYIVSFVAFAPIERPKVAVLALVDQAEEYIEGSGAAAPMVKELLENVLHYLEIEPSGSQGNGESVNHKQEIVLEDYTNMNLMDVTLDLIQLELTYQVVGSGSTVVNQVPKPDTVIPYGSEVMLYVTRGKDGEMTVIPDVMGKTLQEATEELTKANLLPVIEGDEGTVYMQEPNSGIRIEAGSSVHIQLKK